MRKQFPACKKIEDSLCKGSSRHHKHKGLSASASIPQRKEEGARAKLRPILDSVRINTHQAYRSDAKSKMADAQKRSSLAQPLSAPHDVTIRADELTRHTPLLPPSRRLLNIKSLLFSISLASLVKSNELRVWCSLENPIGNFVLILTSLELPILYAKLNYRE